jgi:hypothetical protein
MCACVGVSAFVGVCAYMHVGFVCGGVSVCACVVAHEDVRVLVWVCMCVSLCQCGYVHV